MRRIGMALVCGFVMFVAIMGCRTRQPNLKPQPEPEAIHLPPTGDPRYSSSNMPNEAKKNRTNPYEGLGSIQGSSGRSPGASFGPRGVGGYRP